MPIADEKKILINDILRLATLFEATTKSDNIKLQLEISTDMCRLILLSSTPLVYVFRSRN